MPIPSTLVALDDAQIASMEPALARARSASKAGKPGMLLAQVFGDEMRVFFVESEKAMEIQRILGADVGRTSATAIVR